MRVTYYHSDAMRMSAGVILIILVSLKLAESWLAGEEGWLADYYPDEARRLNFEFGGLSELL